MFRPLLLALSFLGLLACDPPGGPALVKVTGVAASELREGDVLDLRGQPFPEGRSVEVTFRGDVRRAGQPRVRGIELTLHGTSASTHSVTVPITRQVERAFTGIEGAAHTTFHGAIEVSFRPRVAGTPPVTGELPEVVLDFLPAEEEVSVARDRAELARRFAEFAGILLSERGGHVVVEGVMPDGPAEHAGLAGGDRLLEIDGLRVLDPSDLVPPPRARVSELWVDRAEGAGRSRLMLDVAGFEPIGVRDLAPVAGVMAAVVLLIALLASPLGRALTFCEARLTERFLATKQRARPSFGARARSSLFGTVLSHLPASVPPYVAGVAAAALVTALGTGRALVAREIDPAVVFVALHTALTLTVLLFGARGERGVVARLRRVLLVVLQGVVLAAGLGVATVRAAGLGVVDLGLAQGQAPWEWLVARGPIELFSAIVAILSLVPEAARGPSSLSMPIETKKRRVTVPDVVARAHLVVMSGLFVLAFFGGARSGTDALQASTLVHASVLLAKTAAAVALVLVVRHKLGPFDLADARTPTLRAALPVSLGLFGLSLAGRRLPDSAVLVALERASAVACLLIGLAILALVVTRSVVGAKDKTDAGLNPWISGLRVTREPCAPIWK